MRKMVIYGTGGFGREVHETVSELVGWNNGNLAFLGFLDDNPEKWGEEVHSHKILGGIDWLKENKDVEVVIGIGDPTIKQKIVESLRKVHDFKFPSIVNPQVIRGSGVEIGEGCIVCAGTILTTDIEIGNFVTINLSCTVGHDAVIEDYATIAPGVNVSGNVTVGKGSDIGTSSMVIQGKNIGEWSVVGAGAVVVKDIPSYTVSVGNPAKVIKERSPINN
jgi:sugar O-acyltransferase (sialic acid O-acetyltransferase NeuD family)